MQNKQLFNRLLVTIILVCCSQHSWAGVVVKGTRIKNITKEANHSIQEPKVAHKIKTITTTTTEKSMLETTTWPSVYNSDADGRSAFINNEFVAENEEPIVYTSPPFYDALQQQTPHDYNNDSPQIKEALYNGDIEVEKLPEKPIFGHDMGLLGDYEEEEISEFGSESDYMPENCEDSEESLGENDDGKDHAVASQQLGYEKEITDNSGPNIFEQDFHNEPDESNGYGLKTNTNQGSLFDSENTGKNGYQTAKPTQQWYHNSGGTKLGIKSNNKYPNVNNYAQTKPNTQYQPTQQASKQHYAFGQTNQKLLTNQDSYSKSKPQRNQQPYSNKEKSNQNLVYKRKSTQNSKPYNKQQQQQTKPVHSFNDKSLYKTINNNSYNKAESLVFNSDNFNTLTSSSSYLPGSLNSSNPSLTANLSSGNSNTSGHNKSFKTISSSIQYVTTPFADLVFKYSIGMAKLSNSKIGNNSCDSQAQIVNVLTNDNVNGK